LPETRPTCRDCGTVLRQIDARPGKEAWCCPVAMEAQRRGLLGQPGRKHKVVWVYERKHAPVAKGEAPRSAGRPPLDGEVVFLREREQPANSAAR
jgi:hypothetical protein